MGFVVSLPFGGMVSYDFICDTGSALVKVQCKMGRLRNMAVVFNTRPSPDWNRKNSTYGEKDFDFFCVFCPETEKVYVVDRRFTGLGTCKLRLKKPKNNQAKNIKMESDFVLREKSFMRV